MSVVILLGGGWWFRDDLKELLRPAERSDVPAALSKDPLADKEYELKVQQFEMENMFEYTFKKPFIIRHASVKVNIDTASNELYSDPDKFEAWFDAEQPDVVQVPLNVYAKLAADGRLRSLDTLAKANKADLQALHAPLVDYLRQAGGSGELYGLSYEFASTALYVNEDVFAAHGVPLPAGVLTMDEILQLAARFQGTGVKQFFFFFFFYMHLTGSVPVLRPPCDKGRTPLRTAKCGPRSREPASPVPSKTGQAYTLPKALDDDDQHGMQPVRYGNRPVAA